MKTPSTIRLAIRGYAAGTIRFEDRVDVDPDALPGLLPALAEKHCAALADSRLHMIEIEFLDEEDPLERFFRFGSDPSGMVIPIRVDLAD